MITGFNNVYRDKTVMVTGNTGFKGSWLSQWLVLLGAKVYGYALEPPTEPSLFELLKLEGQIDHQSADVRDFDWLKNAIKRIKPDIIFHLAAQSLVSESYEFPLYTIESNVLGTVNVLEAARQIGKPVAIVAVTSDKCYENKEWTHGYRETDPLGGHDPYSASKGAAEILISSWRNSFFKPKDPGDYLVRLASARAGNVIGGGDWNHNHIVADCMRALYNGKPIIVRNPYSTRPWQHVLDALGGYLTLGSRLLLAEIDTIEQYCQPFNFGPHLSSNKTVKELVESILAIWGDGTWELAGPLSPFHESSLLQLSIENTYHKLGWLPHWNFEESLLRTVDWYKEALENPEAISEYTVNQIVAYQNTLNADEGLLSNELKLRMN